MSPFGLIEDRYELLRKLPGGGMGCEVWVASDRTLNRSVVVKLLPDAVVASNAHLERILVDEARAAAALLGHQGIVAILDLKMCNDARHVGPAIVMEYVEGCNLHGWIRDWRPAQDSETYNTIASHIGFELASAVEYAHFQSILHRDLKPMNVLLSKSGDVRLTDFGIAKFMEEATRTNTMADAKTWAYASPEQALSGEVEYSSDVYQLAATLYHLYSGVLACPGVDAFGVMRWHQGGSLFEPLAARVANVPDGVAAIIDAGLAHDPSDRPSAGELRQALSEALASTGRYSVHAESARYPVAHLAKDALGIAVSGGSGTVAPQILVAQGDPVATDDHRRGRALTAGSRWGGHREVFAFGPSGGFHAWVDAPDAAWGDLKQFNGVSDVTVISAACASFQSADLERHPLEVLTLDVDGYLWHSRVPREVGRWSDPVVISGPVGLEEITASSLWPGHCEVFGRTAEDTVIHMWRNEVDGTWSDWHAMPPSPVAAYGIAAASTIAPVGTERTVQVVFVGDASGVAFRVWDEGWSDWTTRPSPSAGIAPIAAAMTQREGWLIGRSENGLLYRRAFPQPFGDWTPWEPLDGLASVQAHAAALLVTSTGHVTTAELFVLHGEEILRYDSAAVAGEVETLGALPTATLRSTTGRSVPAVE